MANIPLAFIGVIFGHLVMGLDITMPSLLGFVSLAGIVVNDSILLVEFVKQHINAGMNPHQAAAKASSERFSRGRFDVLNNHCWLNALII